MRRFVVIAVMACLPCISAQCKRAKSYAPKGYQLVGDTHDEWPFHYPFHIILNLAWGGDWGGQDGVDESALPVTMEVDYVRVYQK